MLDSIAFDGFEVFKYTQSSGDEIINIFWSELGTKYNGCRFNGELNL